MQRDAEPPRRPPMAQFNGLPNAPPPRPYFHGAPEPPYQSDSPGRQHPRTSSPARSARSGRSNRYAESMISDAGSEQWPLPPRPVGQPGSRSSSPRKQGPPRNPHQRPPSNQPRQYYRGKPPTSGPHPRGHPRDSHASVHSQTSRRNHASTQWHGEAYRGPPPPGYGPPYARRPSAPRMPPGQGLPMGYGPQGPHPSSRRPRYPPLVPVPPQRGPGVFSTESPVTPAESLSDNNWPLDLNGVNSLLTPTDPNGPEVKIPSYYFGGKDSDTQSPVARSINENHDSPMESQTNSERESVEELRADEPVVPIRQASLGKKTKPILTMVMTTTNAERRSSANSSADQASVPQTRSSEAPSEHEQQADFEEQLDALPGAWISEGPTPDERRDVDQASEHGSEDALATSAQDVLPEDHAANDDEEEEETSNPRRSSHLLGPPGLFADPAPLAPFEAFKLQDEFHKDSDDDEFDFSFDLDSAQEEQDHQVAMSPIMKEMRRESKQDFSFNVMAAEEDEDREIPLSPVTDVARRSRILDERPVSPVEPDDFLSPMEAHMDHSEGRNRLSSTDVDAIRDAEARGSMTSLPDLIRRATRLRTNLDRGKTASRLGMNFFNGSETDVDVEKYRANARMSGSSADLLSSPNLNSENRKSLGNFSSMLRMSRIPSMDPATEKPSKEPRKYCGMPLWLCLVLLVLVILLIAAAIVIPIVLLVVPKQHTTATGSYHSSSHSDALKQCELNLSCQNSGINIITKDNPCSCLCVNGYTGRTCTEQSSSGCSTMSISSNSAVKATVGEDVKSLITTAKSNYNIPLNAETLLGLFSSGDLTCSNENTLVSFATGSTKNRRSPAPQPRSRESHNHERTKTRSHVSPRSSSSASSSASSSSPSTPASAPSASPSSSAIGTPQEFAGVAVLYILQETGQRDSALEARQKFQDFFSERQQSYQEGEESPNPLNVTLGSGFSANLPKRTLVWTLSNGTVVAN